MNENEMTSNSHDKRCVKKSTDNDGMDKSFNENLTSHYVENVTNVREEITEKVVECTENIHEDIEYRTFSSKSSMRKKNSHEKVEMANEKCISESERFLENTEIICTGTNDHCFIIIDSDYQQNKIPLKHFWINNLHNKIYDVNANKNILNYGKCVDFAETETYDFYEDMTMLNSQSYRTKSMDKNSAELIKGKICKVRERNNRRYTGVISLYGFEFFPFDSSIDDDLTETQFYVSLRQHILDRNLRDDELEDYFNIVRREIAKNITKHETKTKYSEYLYKIMKKYESNKTASFLNEAIETINENINNETDITEQSNKTEAFVDNIESNKIEYIADNETKEIHKNNEESVIKTEDDGKHSSYNIGNNIDTSLNETIEKSISESKTELEIKTFKKYDIFEETLTLSSETTPSISPDQEGLHNHESKNNNCYGKEDDSKITLSQSPSFILNESDLSDMNSDDEREISITNETKVSEYEEIFENNVLYPLSEKVGSDTTTEIFHKTILGQKNIDNDKCIHEEKFLNKNVNDYKNETDTNVYSINSHSDTIDYKSNITSNFETDYKVTSSITHSTINSNMETLEESKIDSFYNNQLPDNIPLYEEIISNNEVINDEHTQMDFDAFNLKFNKSIDNISSQIINEAIKESAINLNSDLYLYNMDNNKSAQIGKIESQTSLYITEEDYYTTRVEKVTKNYDEYEINHLNDEKILEITDKRMEKDDLKSKIKSTTQEDKFNDKDFYHNDHKRHFSNDSNNNANSVIEIERKKSFSSNDSIYHGNIKDFDNVLFIDDQKYKIVEKTTVVKEYFKIKNNADIKTHSNALLKELDLKEHSTSIHHRSKFNSPCNHERSKSTNIDSNRSNEYSDFYSDENKSNFRRYRSSSQSHLTSEDYLTNSLYKKNEFRSNDSKSIYRSSGSLTIVDNHIYKKLSSEDILCQNKINKNIFDEENIRITKPIYDNKEWKSFENVKSDCDIENKKYCYNNSKGTNSFKNVDKYNKDFERHYDTNLINKSITKKDEFKQLKNFSTGKQAETGNNNLFLCDTKRQKNIYEEIDTCINNKSNDDFSYALEENMPIKSEEVIKMNRHLSGDYHFYDTIFNEEINNKTLEQQIIERNKNKFLSKYLHEPIFSKIRSSKVETNIEDKKIKNIESCFVEDKPLAVPVRLEDWENDSCFSDDHLSTHHDLYSKSNLISNNISTTHSISFATSFNTSSLQKKKHNNFGGEECSLTITPKIDMYCKNNSSEKNLTNISQQKMTSLNDIIEKDGKLLSNTTLDILQKSSELEEQKLTIEDDCVQKCLNFIHDIDKSKNITKLDNNQRSESYLNYNSFKNNHNTNIIERSVSDSNETSLVDIVKKVKEQNGIYKYNDTKRKMYLYREDTQNIEDSPSQRDYKSVFRNLKKTTDRSENLKNIIQKNSIDCKEHTSSEDFRNSPIFNKIQNSNKNRFEELKRVKFDNYISKTSSYSSSDFGEPLYRSSFNLSTNHSKIKFEKPIPLIKQQFYERMMTNTRDSSPSSITSENCNQLINVDENSVLHHWNPEKLINQLYKIDYEPHKESKRNRFINMEGHLEVPNTDTNIIPELEKSWKRRYFKTKEGRLTWYATHYADENPEGDILLSGTDIECDKNEGIFFIHGGMENAKIKVRVPREPEGLFDKWRRALLSHSSSSILDAYVQPIAKKIPHSTEKIVILDLGSCSIRGGVLLKEPSLPQSFFPAVGVFKNNGEVVVGNEALKPENRHNGVLHQPIPNTDPAIEKYKINKRILKACIDKVIGDLKIDPSKYKVLLSLPQNIPPTLLGDILKILLDKGYFNGVSITRQPSLILYSYDVTTGVVVDIGERLNIVPVIDGYIVDNAVINLPYGALQIEDSLRVKLNETNEGFYSFQGPVERMILRYLMEQTCYVSNDYEEEIKKCGENDNVEVSLENFDPTPNMKTKFSINASRFIASEGLFKPSRWGIEGKGLHQLINDVIQLSPIDSRRTLYKNIYLSGGTSLLPNLAERLENEIMKLVPPTIHIQVHTSPWRYHAAYLGAQILASSCTFDSNCVSNNQLTEFVNQLKNSAF